VRLIELHPKFLRRLDDTHFHSLMCDDGPPVDIAHADGISFLCPVCFKTNNGPIGTHSVICWQPHVPQTTNPTPGRWKFSGSGYGDLTLTAKSSSILLEGDFPGACKAHFFITNGAIT
jgi:hypothetical protein